MSIKAETDLKYILLEEADLLDAIYTLHLEMKKNLEVKDEVKLRDTVSKINTLLAKFKDLEKKREDIWKEFVGNEKFSSTYEAIEKLSEVYKEDIYNYLHRFKIGVLNIRNLNYLIQNYVDTSLDILDIVFQGVQESAENTTYKNPYGPKGGNSGEASILVNKKL